MLAHDTHKWRDRIVPTRKPPQPPSLAAIFWESWWRRRRGSSWTMQCSFILYHYTLTQGILNLSYPDGLLDVDRVATRWTFMKADLISLFSEVSKAKEGRHSCRFLNGKENHREAEKEYSWQAEKSQMSVEFEKPAHKLFLQNLDISREREGRDPEIVFSKFFLELIHAESELRNTECVA